MVIQGMVKTMGDPIIVICDPMKPDAEDMFTLEQRREMISSALLSADIMDATIVTCKDAPEDANWVKYVMDSAGNPQDIVMWSGRDDVRKYFEEAGYQTKKIVHVPGIDGAELRAQMKAGDTSWRKKVPAGAMDTVDEILGKR